MKPTVKDRPYIADRVAAVLVLHRYTVQLADHAIQALDFLLDRSVESTSSTICEAAGSVLVR